MPSPCVSSSLLSLSLALLSVFKSLSLYLFLSFLSYSLLLCMIFYETCILFSVYIYVYFGNIWTLLLLCYPLMSCWCLLLIFTVLWQIDKQISSHLKRRFQNTRCDPKRFMFIYWTVCLGSWVPLSDICHMVKKDFDN